MFDEKMSYIDDFAGVRDAARAEDADLVVPAYVRLARFKICRRATPRRPGHCTRPRHGDKRP